MDIQAPPAEGRNGSVPLENDDDVIDSTFDSRVHLELNDDTGDLFLLILKKQTSYIFGTLPTEVTQSQYVLILVVPVLF